MRMAFARDLSAHLCASGAGAGRKETGDDARRMTPYCSESDARLKIRR